MSDLVPIQAPGGPPDSRPTVLFPAALAADAPRFLATLPYDPRAFFISELTSVDPAARKVAARVDTSAGLPFVEHQRGGEALHPKHVNGGVLVHLTGMLGLVHAYFFDGLRFDEGWIGYGGRIHRAEFRTLARIGPPLELSSVETRRRDGADRKVVRYEFEFRQEGRVVYVGDQTASWLRGPAGADEDA